MGVGKFSESRGDGLCRTMTFSRGGQTPDDTMIYLKIILTIFMNDFHCSKLRFYKNVGRHRKKLGDPPSLLRLCQFSIKCQKLIMFIENSGALFIVHLIHDHHCHV